MVSLLTTTTYLSPGLVDISLTSIKTQHMECQGNAEPELTGEYTLAKKVATKPRY